MIELPSDISGTVVNYFSNQPVQGALVKANGYSTYSDSNGRFSFSNLPSKSYLLTVEKTDHEIYSMSLNLSVAGAYSIASIKVKPIFKAF